MRSSGSAQLRVLILATLVGPLWVFGRPADRDAVVGRINYARKKTAEVKADVLRKTAQMAFQNVEHDRCSPPSTGVRSGGPRSTFAVGKDYDGKGRVTRAVLDLAGAHGHPKLRNSFSRPKKNEQKYQKLIFYDDFISYHVLR